MNKKEIEIDFEVWELTNYFDKKIDFTFSFFVVIIFYALFESLEIFKRTLRIFFK